MNTNILKNKIDKDSLSLVKDFLYYKCHFCKKHKEELYYCYTDYYYKTYDKEIIDTELLKNSTKFCKECINIIDTDTYYSKDKNHCVFCNNNPEHNYNYIILNGDMICECCFTDVYIDMNLDNFYISNNIKIIRFKELVKYHKKHYKS